MTTIVDRKEASTGEVLDAMFGPHYPFTGGVLRIVRDGGAS